MCLAKPLLSVFQIAQSRRSDINDADRTSLNKGRSSASSGTLRIIMSILSFGYLDGPLSPRSSLRMKESWETSIYMSSRYTLSL